MVLDDGYAWNGCVYRSLSQVAKAITGTNWNGHRFFGLKAVRNGASNRKRSATPRPNPLLDIGVSPALAALEQRLSRCVAWRESLRLWLQRAFGCSRATIAKIARRAGIGPLVSVYRVLRA